jgi:class 3 adenylate cyclase
VLFDESMQLTSEARLWSLIEQRTADGADVAAIDARIWELFGERWAVVFTDLAGFSRKTNQFGIIHFLQIIFKSKQLIYPVVIDSAGLILKSEGDSLMLLFRTAERALRCSIEMQRAVQMASARMVPEDQVLLSIGVGYGDVLRVGDHDVWGHEVNVASKLGEDTAAPHDILVTAAVVAEVGDAFPDLSFEPLRREVAGSTSNFRVVYSAASRK